MAQEEVNILRIEVDQASAAKELAAVRKSIAELTKERNELNKKIKEGNELTEEEIKDLGRVEKQLAEAKNGEREFTKVIQAQNNSLNQLRNSLAQLTRLRNQVDTSTDDGRKRFADLTVQIKEYSDSIKRAEEAGGDFRRSVGNYGKALEGLRGAAGKARQSISFLGKALAATGIIKLVGILSSVASSFTSTNEGAEELAKLLGQIEGISKPFIQQMQKIGLVVGSTLVKAFTQVGAVLQSFKNFDVFNFSESIKSIEDAIAPLSKTISEAGEEIEKINAGFDFNKAIEEGKRLGAQFAALRKNQRDLNIEQAKYERDLFKIRNNIEALKNIRDNETQSIIKRIDANEQLSQLEKDALTEGERIAKRRIELIQQEINLNGGRAKSSEELVLSEIEAQKVLFEIQEDSAGRVNENITNRVALQREASEQELEVFTRLIRI
jgi:chromosome segregation ATPase